MRHAPRRCCLDSAGSRRDPAMTRNAANRALALVLTCAVAVALMMVSVAPADAARLDLHRGSHGATVRLLESRLHRIDLLVASAVDGRYRQATVNSVKRFQRHHHVPATGRVNQ